MQLTTEMLMKGTGCTSAVAGVFLAPMQKAITKWKCDQNALRLAAFLANVGVESDGLTAFVENTNYSAARLAVVWPFRYAQDVYTAAKIPNNTAVRIGGNPVLVASNVYANRMGNGPEESRDGWNYRGQGAIQLTGREEILKYFAASGLPLDSDPSLLQKPDAACDSAAWFFSTCGAVDFADQGNFDMVVARINGQKPCPANQGQRRQALYAAVVPVLAAAFAPAKTVAKPAAPAKTAPQTPSPQTKPE